MNSEEYKSQVNGIETGALVAIEYREDGGSQTLRGRFEGVCFESPDSREKMSYVDGVKSQVVRDKPLLHQFRLEISNEVKVLVVDNIYSVKRF